MDCSEVRTNLLRYVDDDVSTEVRRGMDDHLDHCYLCNEDLCETIKVMEACRAALRHPVPTNRFDELQPALRSTLCDPPVILRPNRHLLGKFSALAAIAALILMVINVGGPAISTARQWASIDKAIAAHVSRTTFEEELKREPAPNLLNWRLRLQTVQATVDSPNRVVTEVAEHAEAAEPDSVSMRNTRTCILAHVMPTRVHEVTRPC